MLDNKVWIIIPAYNEQARLEKVIRDLLTKTSNIIVVNDASTDQTAQIMEDLPIFKVHHSLNRGQGAALQTGTELALKNGAEVIVHFDADGQMQVEDIAKVIAPILEQRAEIVFGSRFLDNNSQIPWSKKYLILKPALIFNWFFTGIRLTDVHNGFRALSGKAASLIEINLDGMAHATEILDQVRIYKLPYQEVPVKIIYHEYGQRFSKGFKIIRDLIFARLTKN